MRDQRAIKFNPPGITGPNRREKMYQLMNRIVELLRPILFSGEGS